MKAIPEGWEYRPVKSLGSVVAGKALAAYGPGEQRPYLRTKNVLDGQIDLDDVMSMPMTDAEFGRFELRQGDVLLNEGQSLDLVGRCAMYGGEHIGPCAIQNQLLRFRAHEGVSPEFAMQVFRRCQQNGAFARIALQTTSVAHLGVTRFEKLQLLWPKGEIEQRAIAAALCDADALLNSLDALIAKKQAIKLGAMQQLLTRKTRLPGFVGKWETRRLGDLGNWVGGLTPSMAKSSYWLGGTTEWLTSSDIRPGKIGSASGRITLKALAETSVPLVPAHSVLVVIRSGILRRFLPVACTSVAMAINQDIRALRPSNGHDARFLMHALIGFGNRILTTCMKAGTTVESIDAKWFRWFELQMPEVSEQRAIATVLSNMDADIAAVELRRDKMRSVKQGMMQQLLSGRIRLVAPEVSAGA